MIKSRKYNNPLRLCLLLNTILCAVSVASVIFLMSAGTVVQSFAHTTIQVGKYDVEAGWGTEPPIVGLRNTVVMSVHERGEIEGQYTGISYAFRGVEATIFYGGESKAIAFNPDLVPGEYYSPIIPTKTGTYLVHVTGDIRGVPVDIKIPIEDVEHTAALAFPAVPVGAGSGPQGDSGIDPTDLVALKKAVRSLQGDVSDLTSGVVTFEPRDVPDVDGSMAYNFAVLGLSMSAVAIVLGVLSLTRKPIV